jgi:hypothetical protein
MTETATEIRIGTTTVKKGLAQMLKGGVIVSQHTEIGLLYTTCLSFMVSCACV